MANCHYQFSDFNTEISLNKERKSSLKRTRTLLRNRIRTDFKENHLSEPTPKFTSQGSSEMKTSINPIVRKVDEGGKEKRIVKYDTDDGVYFIGELSNRKSPQTYHNWIKDAVEGHTNVPPEDKNTCIRTLFSDGHHIDQPIYYIATGSSETNPQLAHRTKGWIDSDPKKFTEWFNAEAHKNQQLRRLVKYLKAWCDFQNYETDSKKMPTGFVMTIWATNSFSPNDRDDIALKDTIRKIYNSLLLNFECLRPTTPINENVLEKYTYETFFMEKLKNFVESAEQAINETNPKNACYKWQKHFGSRFVCSTAKDEDEGAKSFGAPAVITNNAKSA